ncbi:MAG: hypothetical protein KTR27_18720 [Leptolyngbyaceae cyanobacterium MAG.088]|nr:hypothetical protein [Leptolyngbyaceae cyanobacterium MAG.088]
MNSSTVEMTLDRDCGAYQLADEKIAQSGQWFLNIPPERIGLHGEFDYYGLSKRVSHRLSSLKAVLGRLKVRQRGRVVVLSGKLGSLYQLNEVVTLVHSVDGVDEVDARAVAVVEAA